MLSLRPMGTAELLQTGYGQLQLVFALFVVCALLALVLPFLIERIASRGY